MRRTRRQIRSGARTCKLHPVRPQPSHGAGLGIADDLVDHPEHEVNLRGSLLPQIDRCGIEGVDRPIPAGDQAADRAAFGDLLERVALTGVEMGRDFPVVWVCSREEGEAASIETDLPDGLPWPADDVHLVDRPVEAHA